ncbi:hypothetical protein AB1L30_04680 [Bremerella sp. JC817]|uniref:hypothetical protein n=1 Tax=Bremerella sp. JC817 TaxID=3231756 RepID=UPI003457E10B
MKSPLNLCTILGIAALLLAMLILPGAVVSGQEGATPISDRARMAEEQEKKSKRLREGAEVVDTKGSFEWIGDRLSFNLDGEQVSLKILENRMMERVVQTQESSTGELVWVVTGTVTEYRGGNYLLMTHVVLDGKRGN